jgi:hypothetical protein
LEKPSNSTIFINNFNLRHLFNRPKIYGLFINPLLNLYTRGHILYSMSKEKDMPNYLLNTANNFSNTFKRQRTSIRGFWSIWHIGAGIGLLGGALLLIGSCFLIVFQYFSGEETAGVWLFLTILLLWILGAHCLDKVEEIEKVQRIEFSQTSLNL